jgi:hypothetical protein
MEIAGERVSKINARLNLQLGETRQCPKVFLGLYLCVEDPRGSKKWQDTYFKKLENMETISRLNTCL